MDISGPLAESQLPLVAPREGMSTDDVDRILDSGRLSLAELDRLAVPRKTLAHRRILGCLTLEQSDRVRRLVPADSSDRMLRQCALAMTSSPGTQVTLMPAPSSATITVSTAAHWAQSSGTGRLGVACAGADEATGQLAIWEVI